MFIAGTYIGIISCLFSAFVLWLCFLWRRRFSDSSFNLYGTLAVLAFLWAALVTFTESSLASRDSVQRTFHAWRESGSISPDTTLDKFQELINARNSSMIVVNVGLSFAITFIAGLGATAAFGRAAHKLRQRVQSQ
jgi:hypothetical protein